MAAKPAPDVTEAELNVLHALWEDGPSTIRQLTDRLYPGGATAHYTTVQKLLDRLEAKDCVTRDRAAMTHVFAAAIDRGALIGGQVRALAERLCGGSLTPLLTHLVQTNSLTDDDRKQLRRLLSSRQRKP